MRTMRLLIVEDEIRLARLIAQALSNEGYAVDIAHTGEDALALTQQVAYIAIVLDVMLPGMSGIDVCRSIRSKKIQTPVLLLTARDAIEDRVLGLDAGADDYLVKPFAFAELFARLRALIRRPPETVDTTLAVADIRLDTAGHRVWRGDDEIALRNKELRILELLMRRPGQIMTRTMIAEQVWDYDFDLVTNVIDVHIRALRDKIDAPYATKRIMTVRGLGYKLVDDPDG